MCSFIQFHFFHKACEATFFSLLILFQNEEHTALQGTAILTGLRADYSGVETGLVRRGQSGCFRRFSLSARSRFPTRSGCEEQLSVTECWGPAKLFSSLFLFPPKFIYFQGRSCPENGVKWSGGKGST